MLLKWLWNYKSIEFGKKRKEEDLRAIVGSIRIVEIFSKLIF